MMFVRDLPSPIDFAQADRQPEIQPFLLTVGSRLSTTHRRDDESDILPGRDVHLRDVEWHRIAGPGKKGVPRLPVGFDSSGLKRRRDIEHYDVRRMVFENPFEISTTHSGGPGFNHIANGRLVV
jgi:hypothetical protein